MLTGPCVDSLKCTVTALHMVRKELSNLLFPLTQLQKAFGLLWSTFCEGERGICIHIIKNADNSWAFCDWGLCTIKCYQTFLPFAHKFPPFEWKTIGGEKSHNDKSILLFRISPFQNRLCRKVLGWGITFIELELLAVSHTYHSVIWESVRTAKFFFLSGCFVLEFIS